MNKIKIEIWQFENGNLNIEIVDYTDKIRIPMDFTKKEIDENKELNILWMIKKLLQKNTEALKRLKNDKDEPTIH